MGWSCEFYGDTYYVYRERIATSDGTIRCCESGILIPEGFPYADCRAGWPEGTEPEWRPYVEAGLLDEFGSDELQNDVALQLTGQYPQAIEVWRLIRNDSYKRGACPTWEFALEEYRDAAFEGDQSDQLALVCLLSTIKRTRRRYAEGKRPRLHSHEAASLKGGEYVSALRYSVRQREDSA